MTELERAIEAMAFRLFGKDFQAMIWEDACPEIQEWYRAKARKFVETVRQLHTPDPQP